VTRRYLGFAAALLILLGLALFHAPLLIAYGDLLVDSQPPSKADAILVLAGDFGGDRIRMAGELLRKGFAPYALVSGPMPIYGVNEADLAIEMMKREGYADVDLRALYLKASSTREESRQVAAEMGRRQVRRLLIVTSDYHTARAGRLFRKAMGSSVEIHMVAAKDPHFPRESWWREREGLKTIFYESLKTVSSAVER
jgi:uncharacterized SAM-binding protein YcdF (DUF218 family)